jgi:hypothetical protein
MACLPPAERPLAFWHVAGDIIWRGDGRPTPITERTAREMRDLFAEETAANFHAERQEAAVVSAGLWLQLTKALDALDGWRRAVTAARAA